MLKKQEPDYYQIIPEHLHQEADALVDYVRYFPYQFPTQCPHCGYHSFRQIIDKDLTKQPRFICYQCKRNFNQLTGTPFAAMSHIDLWPDFAIYRLSGLSLQKISELLGISQNACHIRNKKLSQMMLKMFPELYQWWQPHDVYQDKTFTKQVAKQRSIFLKWLKGKIEQQTANCPTCGKFIKQRAFVGGHNGKESQNKNRPYFECSKCHKAFSILKNTALDKLTHIELWVDFAKGLCQGKSNYQIMASLPQPIMKKTASNWRNKFMEQMQILQLEQLIYWINWQRSRNKGAETRKTKAKMASFKK